VPVFNSHPSFGFPDLGIGTRITEQRKAKKITLRQLATKVKISAAQLSNIENGKAKLNLGQVAKIAQALETQVTALLPKSVELPFLINRRERTAAERPRPIRPVAADGTERQSHNFSSPLAEAFIGKQMVPALAEIHPLADNELQLIGHHHEEFFFVLRGDVETQIKTNDGFVTERTTAGDCLYLRSHLPHCHRSLDGENAQVLSVACSLRSSVDADDDEFGQPRDSSFFRRSYHANITQEVAEKVALLRRSRRLSIQELARIVDVSPRTLTAVERGSRPVELSLLLRLAIEFKRPLESFFTETMEPGPSHILVRRTDVASLPTRLRKLPGIDNMYRPLADAFPTRGLHPYYVQMKRSGYEGFEHHPGQEFGFVLEGEVELVVETAGRVETNILNRGDSYFLDASARHRLCGAGDNPYAQTNAELIIVFWTPINENSLFDDATPVVVGA
jgi:transcriptional regulator with XRE-family HTH domain